MWLSKSTSGVPQKVVVVQLGSRPSLQRPKSVRTMWPCESRRMFSGFRSLPQTDRHLLYKLQQPQRVKLYVLSTQKMFIPVQCEDFSAALFTAFTYRRGICTFYLISGPTTTLLLSNTTLLLLNFLVFQEVWKP